MGPVDRTASGVLPLKCPHCLWRAVRTGALPLACCFAQTWFACLWRLDCCRAGPNCLVVSPWFAPCCQKHHHSHLRIIAVVSIISIVFITRSITIASSIYTSYSSSGQLHPHHGDTTLILASSSSLYSSISHLTLLPTIRECRIIFSSRAKI